MIHVIGEADDIVPPAENAVVVARRYREFGSTVHVISEPGKGHHPHGLEDPQPVVDFVTAHASVDRTAAVSP